MNTGHIPGTEGYVEHAASLVPNWQQLSFTDKPEAVLALIPTAPSRVLDIGAGIGVDAAGLAAMGHRVVAVEPVEGLREPGRLLHPSPAIEWVADGLPNLAVLMERPRQFDLIMLSAVWMHLDGAAEDRLDAGFWWTADPVAAAWPGAAGTAHVRGFGSRDD